jgi:tRNA U55 pseudouridine synthase TruB
LGCGAYLQALRRTKIGEYKAEDALSVEEWMEYLKSQTV